MDIQAEVIDDLPYIDLEQFEDIRLGLAYSHRNGRTPHAGYMFGTSEQSAAVYVCTLVNVDRVERSALETTRGKGTGKSWVPKTHSAPPHHTRITDKMCGDCPGIQR